MNRIRYTLVTDGSSDRLLKYPIEWLLETLTACDFDGEWANPDAFLKRRESGLVGRVAAALEYYPCDLLFVHRDAERQPRECRVGEIKDAVGRLSAPPPAVCVVPVRMTEAWLLIDEQALRGANWGLHQIGPGCGRSRGPGWHPRQIPVQSTQIGRRPTLGR